MTFGEEICDILSDLNINYNLTLRGYFFFEEDSYIPIADVVWGGIGWGFCCDGNNGEWEWFETEEEAQEVCRQWAKSTADTIIRNKEKKVWG